MSVRLSGEVSLVEQVSIRADMKKAGSAGWRQQNSGEENRGYRRKNKKFCFWVLTSADFINRIERFLNRAVPTDHLFHLNL
jgi:hypothetical protein